MLSDEERKAIDYLQLCYDLSTITNESLSKLGIVLNLIEKQSKEIEDLNKENTRQHELIGNIHQKWEDKIKAKIEEVCESAIEESNVDLLYSLLEKE